MSNKNIDELDKMLTMHLKIKIAESCLGAPNYDKSWKLLQMKEAIVVKKGMASGEPSVDLQMVDDKGNEYLVMTSGNLLKALAKVIIGVEAREEAREEARDGVEGKDPTIN